MTPRTPAVFDGLWPGVPIVDVEPESHSEAGSRLGHVLVTEPFSSDDLPRVRARCYCAAVGAGLPVDRALMFTFAVDVGMINAVQHGGGFGVVTIVCEPENSLVAEVVDRGNGVVAPRDDHRFEAQLTPTRGLWLAERLVDKMFPQLRPHGTILRLVAALGRYPWAGSRHDARLAALIAEVMFT